ncbi:hypothetical protein AB0D67_37845 [Streptosporangium sp. NPDC048047]
MSKPTEEEKLIEEMLGELVELRAENEQLRRPAAPVVDLNARRRR